jgi:hypothetical protein
MNAPRAVARTLLHRGDTRGAAAAGFVMKTIVISLSLLLLLLACGKRPEDPHAPKRPVLPGMASGPAVSSDASGGRGLFGEGPAGRQRLSAVRSR